MNQRTHKIAPDELARRLNLGRRIRNMFLTHTQVGTLKYWNDTLSIANQLNMKESEVCDLLHEARQRDKGIR